MIRWATLVIAFLLALLRMYEDGLAGYTYLERD